jgi:PPOX class probable F420-dependent enzyme
MKLTEKAATMIDGKNFGNLAFVTPKGEPHVSPVWIDREGDLILINAAEFRQKIKFLNVNQKVMLSITEQQNPYEKVLIRGHVVEITKDDALEQNDRMAMKYLGTTDDPSRPPGDRVLIKIQPDKITN